LRTRVVYLPALLFLFVLGIGNLLADGLPAVPMPPENPAGNTGALKPQVQTGGSYDIHSGNATRIVNDLHVPGALGTYGLDFTRYWNSLHDEDENAGVDWPTEFGYSGWSHSWRWKAVFAWEVQVPENGGAPPIYITSITITFPDGHATKFKLTRTTGYPWGDGRCGPPYYANHHEDAWPIAGEGVHDHLAEMAQDGSEFFIYLSDGGSVRFTGYDPVGTNGVVRWNYRATEVYDPHGLRTTLSYTDGLLTGVADEGNRWLNIVWKNFQDTGWRVIGRVETGGDAGSQQVIYNYTLLGIDPVLAKVLYPDTPALGQTASALYTYSHSYHGDQPGVGPQSDIPILKRAHDPHFAGAMTKIFYNYFGRSDCRPPNSLSNPPPEGYFDWYWFSPETIWQELSDGAEGWPVSQFPAVCKSATRTEINGFGGERTFYFGRSANDSEIDENMGYQLTKVTDFAFPANPPGLPFRKQNGPEPTKVWDGRNIKTELEYDDSGEPSRIHNVLDGSDCFYDRIDAGNASGSQTPDGSRMHNQQHHWLFKKTDERGQITKYKRDQRRRVIRIDYPDTSFEEYSYTDFNQVRTHRLPSGTTQHYEYDEHQHLRSEWNDVDLEENAIIYDYDSLERVAWVQNPLARSWGKPFSAKMEYNGRHQVTKVTYPSVGSGNDPFVTYQYDNYGNCIAIIDELGHRTDYTYDSYRRCTSMTQQVNSSGANCPGAVSRRWDWIYDRVIDYGPPNGVWPIPKLPSSHTSKEWRIQIEPEFNAARERRATARIFDVNNRMLSEETGLIQLHGEDLGILHAVSVTETHRVTYDENGQKSSVTDQFGRRTDYLYNSRNWLERTIEHPMPGSTDTVRTTQTFYNRAGNKTLVIFPDEKRQEWPELNYDAFGQPHVFIDERGNTTNLDYWPWGPMKKLAQVTTHRSKDGGGTENQLTAFFPDKMGRPWRTNFPDGTYEENSYQFGQLSTWRTRRNQKEHLYYDARGRESSHSWENGAAPGAKRLWDDANRLTRIWNAYSNIDYSYDEGGQMLMERTTVAGSGAPREVRYCRYPSGEVSRVAYPDGSTVVNRNYTARGQLERASWGSGSVDYAYLRDGKLDYEDYGNGVRSDLDYNGRGFINLTKTYRQSPVQTYAKRDYWRDDRDRIEGWKKGNDPSANPKENGRGDRYDYDDEGQLKTASYQVENPLVGGTGAERADSFHYDELGNRVGWNDVASRGAMWFERRDNKLNQYESWNNNYPEPLHWGSPIYHDDNWGTDWVPPGNGVTIADGWITAAYNALNQPVAMGNIGYGSNYMWFWYDPLGRCVKRWKGTGNQTPVGPITYFYYDEWNLIQEGTTATVVDRVYVHGNRVDEIVASAASGNWLYHHYDARGHCILQTSATDGGLQEQYDYDAFGWPYFYTANGARVPQSGSGNRFLFTGREFLSDLRIYDYRARMYQPELGRFLQPDPKQFEAGDYNLYRYCHNDPVNKSDPTGLDLIPTPTSFVTSALIGFAAVVKYDAQKLLGTAPTDDKALHQNTSQLMTELGDPISALLLGEVQELYAPNKDSNDDRAANLMGIRAGILSQLGPLGKLAQQPSSDSKQAGKGEQQPKHDQKEPELEKSAPRELKDKFD
jgi:RHS repeat-associated protein